MSTAIPAGAPAPAAPAKEIRRPLMWLLAILALGLVLRAMHLRDAGFEVDEFTSLSAVAERHDAQSGQPLPLGTTATKDDPLVPVATLAEVSNRSVIPFGIQDPVPLYNDILWATVHVLPPSDWALRLPSLLAGLACVVVVFFLVRALFGTEVALVAALFVALDPIQISTGWLARPMALGNLAAVLSFWALWGALHARKPATALLLSLAYGLCVAALGYLCALLLLVVFAHLGMIVCALRGTAEGAARNAGLAALGLVVGLVLLAPEYGYFYQVGTFAYGHADFLRAAADIHLLGPIVTLFRHNLVLIGGLLLIAAAGAVVRMQLQGGTSEEKPEGEGGPATDGPVAEAGGGTATAVTAAPPAATSAAPAAAPAATAAAPEPAGEPLPENDEAVWMTRVWVFLPQVALLLVSLLVVSVFFSRYLSYTTIGAAILLAYFATRDASREVRLGVSGAVALALLVFGFWGTMSMGSGLFSSPKARDIMLGQAPYTEGGFAGTGMTQLWKPGDVILMRSGLAEADLLGSDIPAAVRPQVERAILAPLTTLYPDSSRKPVIALSYSEYRNEKVKTPAGDPKRLETFYDADFVARLKGYNRFWMTGVGPDAYPNSWYYLAGIVPWMSTKLDRGDLVLARNRDKEERYITVKPNLGLDEPIKGLAPKPGETVEDLRGKDFENFAHVVRTKTADDAKYDKKEEKKDEKK